MARVPKFQEDREKRVYFKVLSGGGCLIFGGSSSARERAMAGYKILAMKAGRRVAAGVFT